MDRLFGGTADDVSKVVLSQHLSRRVFGDVFFAIAPEHTMVSRNPPGRRPPIQSGTGRWPDKLGSVPARAYAYDLLFEQIAAK